VIINSPKELSKYIDHTMLKPDATELEIEKLSNEALKYKFASVCINPCFVSYAFNILKDSDVKVCSVIDFPLGSGTREIKAAEAIKAVADGADELDMVMNISYLKSRKYDEVEKDISYVADSIPEHIILKVILEICYLTDEEIRKACLIAIKAGADFVKTSTGFGKGGATVEAVKVMKEVVRNRAEVKAAGGIRDFDTAKAMIESGATRIGASSSLKIISAE